MSALNEIKAFLDSIGGLGTITIGNMAASPDALGTLYAYGGQPPERRFGVVGMGYEKPAIQLVFRGAPFDYAGPEAKAWIALRALMAVQPGLLGASTYLSIDPQQSPFPVEVPDGNNRNKIGFNFYVLKEA